MCAAADFIKEESRCHRRGLRSLSAGWFHDVVQTLNLGSTNVKQPGERVLEARTIGQTLQKFFSKLSSGMDDDAALQDLIMMDTCGVYNVFSKCVMPSSKPSGPDSLRLSQSIYEMVRRFVLAIMDSLRIPQTLYGPLDPQKRVPLDRLLLLIQHQLVCVQCLQFEHKTVETIAPGILRWTMRSDAALHFESLQESVVPGCCLQSCNWVHVTRPGKRKKDEASSGPDPHQDNVNDEDILRKLYGDACAAAQQDGNQIVVASTVLHREASRYVARILSDNQTLSKIAVDMLGEHVTERGTPWYQVVYSYHREYPFERHGRPDIEVLDDDRTPIHNDHAESHDDDSV